VPGTAKGIDMTVITYDMIFNTIAHDPLSIFGKMQACEFLKCVMKSLEDNHQNNDGEWSDWAAACHLYLANDSPASGTEWADFPELQYLRLILDLNRALEAQQ